MSSRSSKSISVELGNDECAVFLRETFDRTLLKRYYNELLVPLIPFEDERDSIEKIETGLKRTVEELQSGEYEDKPYVNVCVLVSKRGEIGADFGEVDLFGAIHFEYYCTANVGLINYLLVNEKFRGKGMARKLVARAQYQMELIAKYFGHLAGDSFETKEKERKRKKKKEKEKKIKTTNNNRMQCGICRDKLSNKGGSKDRCFTPSCTTQNIPQNGNAFVGF